MTSLITPNWARQMPTTVGRAEALHGDGLILNLAASSLVRKIDDQTSINQFANSLVEVSGMFDGCAFIEILPEGKMLNLGFL